MEDALWRIAMFLQFQFFDTRFPEADGKGPGEGQRQQCKQSAQAFRVFQLRVFEVEAPRFQRPE